MLELAFTSLIFVLLVIGCYTDIKRFHVSNEITYTIALLCLPMLVFNDGLLLMKALFSIFLLVMWRFNQIGGADVKVLIPIMFTLSSFIFLLFLGIMSITGMMMFVSGKKEIPQFIPIAIGYFVVGVLRFL